MSRRRGPRTVWIAAGSVLAAALLAACGGSEGDASVATPGTPTPWPATATPQPLPPFGLCGSAALWERLGPWTLGLRSGPIVLLVPLADPRTGMVATGRQTRDGKTWLVQKMGLEIDAPVGAKVHMRTSASIFFDHGDGFERTWDIEIGTLNHPPGRPAFIPNAFFFEAPGCHQLFVAVDGVEYGPFGFAVAAPTL